MVISMLSPITIPNFFRKDPFVSLLLLILLFGLSFILFFSNNILMASSICFCLNAMLFSFFSYHLDFSRGEITKKISSIDTRNGSDLYFVNDSWISILEIEENLSSIGRPRRDATSARNLNDLILYRPALTFA